jgi:hypothetical protein
VQVRKAFLSVVTAVALAVIFATHMNAFSFGGDGTYTFLQHQPGDPSTPVTFSSCKPIKVEFNLDGVDDPETAKRIILSAMGEVSAASGLQLQYAGPTKRRPVWRDPTLTLEGGAWPVLVAFATPAELPEMRGAAGRGGGTAFTNGTVTTYETGIVVLETDYFNGLDGRFRGMERRRATVLHELGHVLGLGHVQDRGEVMNKKSIGVTELGPGDRRGLARLGKGPCT